MYLVQMCTNEEHYPRQMSGGLYFTFKFREQTYRYPEFNTQLGFRG